MFRFESISKTLPTGEDVEILLKTEYKLKYKYQ
jgi:hypothetical protein